MTFPSSSAPLAGISRARLPAWALPDGWPTQANGEPLLADLAFRDGRIATLTPTDQPTPGLWDLAGALTLPGLVEPHAHLDKTFTIERCRPAQAGLLITAWPLTIVVVAPLAGLLIGRYPDGLLGAIGQGADSFHGSLDNTAVFGKVKAAAKL